MLVNSTNDIVIIYCWQCYRYKLVSRTASNLILRQRHFSAAVNGSALSAKWGKIPVQALKNHCAGQRALQLLGLLHNARSASLPVLPVLATSSDSCWGPPVYSTDKNKTS